MKKYIKDNKIKTRNEIVIVKDKKQYICPSEELLLAEGWVEYVPVVYEPTEEELLLKEKELIKTQITSYDSSEEVNMFYVNGIPVWLDKATRSGLMLRFQSEIALGKTNTSLWYNGIEFPLPLEMAMQMLYAIEVYASNCYDNTQKHLAEVDKLNTIDEVKEYNYKTGYPEKLQF